MLGRRLDHIGGAGAELVLGILVQPVVIHQLGVAAFDDGHHLLTGDGLLLEEVSGDLIQQLAVLRKDGLGIAVALAENTDGLAVGGSVSLLCAGHGVGAVEVLVMDSTQRHHVELLAHTEAGHHAAGKLRCTLDVVGSAGGGGVAHHFLGRAACQQRADLRHNVLAGH